MNLDILVGLLGRGSARRKASTYTGQQNTKNTDTHPCLELDSNPRSQCSSGVRQNVP